MKIYSGGVATIKTEKNCWFILETTNGKITMHGYVINGQVKKHVIAPSTMDAEKYNTLCPEEKLQAIDLVYDELKNYR